MIGPEQLISTPSAGKVDHYRSYSFLNMLVLINPSLENFMDADEDPDLIDHWGYRHNIHYNHHVHIYMSVENVTADTILRMVRFIGLTNMISRHPVYIHMPKKEKDTAESLRYFLSKNRYKGEDLRYRIITEKNNLVTTFNYGTDFIPADGEHYSVYFGQDRELCQLLISWSENGYAKPVFRRPSDGKTREVFK